MKKQILWTRQWTGNAKFDNTLSAAILCLRASKIFAVKGQGHGEVPHLRECNILEARRG